MTALACFASGEQAGGNKIACARHMMGFLAGVCSGGGGVYR